MIAHFRSSAGRHTWKKGNIHGKNYALTPYTYTTLLDPIAVSYNLRR
jgi:hypothetical protein